MSYRMVRTRYDKIKRTPYIQYIQQSCREKKEKNKKKLICVNYTTREYAFNVLYMSVSKTYIAAGGW